MAIHFFSKSAAFREFSNFAPFPFELDGLRWPTVEHYFQAQKFLDAEYRARIRTARSPAEAKALGRSRAIALRPDWDTVKDGIMEQAVRAKFLAHESLAGLLLSTGEEELIEAVRTDYYWGAGRDGSGQNKLGHILMRLRAELRRHAVENLGT